VRVRKLEGKRGWAVAVAAGILKPMLLAATSRTWIDGQKLPATGGCVVVLNHVSYADPLLSAHLVYDHGRLPRYLAKAGLFRNKYLGGFLLSAGQIPVERLSRNAVGAYDAAVQAVRDGACVIVYPEGTLTRDPDMWPMRGKTGAVRLALEADLPLYPMAHWGAQAVMARYGKKLDVWPPRKKVRVVIGDPVNLDAYRGQPLNPAALAAATTLLMNDITRLLEGIRGEKAPAERWDPASHSQNETGRFES